jgi:hypothetical protein
MGPQIFMRKKNSLSLIEAEIAQLVSLWAFGWNALIRFSAVQDFSLLRGATQPGVL